MDVFLSLRHIPLPCTFDLLAPSLIPLPYPPHFPCCIPCIACCCAACCWLIFCMTSPILSCASMYLLVHLSMQLCSPMFRSGSLKRERHLSKQVAPIFTKRSLYISISVFATNRGSGPCCSPPNQLILLLYCKWSVVESSWG